MTTETVCVGDGRTGSGCGPSNDRAGYTCSRCGGMVLSRAGLAVADEAAKRWDAEEAARITDAHPRVIVPTGRSSARVVYNVPDAMMACIIPWRIVPAKRTNRRDFSPQAKAYHADQKRLADYIQVVATRFDRLAFLSPYDGRVRLGVAAFVRPCKSGPHKGDVPGNIGDWDNYFKAVADCLVYRGWLTGDTARTMRGPGRVLVPATWGFGPDIDSGIYTWPTDATTPEAATVFTIWRTER